MITPRACARGKLIICVIIVVVDMESDTKIAKSGDADAKPLGVCAL